MKKVLRSMKPHHIVMYSGAFLLVVGVGLTVAEYPWWGAGVEPRLLTFTAPWNTGMELRTDRAGLVLVAIGAFLEVVGVVASTIVTRRQSKQGAGK